jgi:pimeloyl-ACP methyl ester carboxylesterase
MPAVDEFKYTFDNLADVIEKFTEKPGLKKYMLYVQDYGAPVGYRLAAKHPDHVQALVVQNGNAYDEGIDNDFWKPIKAYWNAKSAARHRTLRARGRRRHDRRPDAELPPQAHQAVAPSAMARSPPGATWGDALGKGGSGATRGVVCGHAA